MPLSKQVSDLKKFAQAVAACEVWSDKAALGIEARLADDTDAGGATIDTPAFIGKAIARMNRVLTLAEQADERHAIELSDDAGILRERDEAAASLSDRMVAIRRSVAGNYGPDAIAPLGLDQATPVDPEHLRRFAAKFAATISASGFTMPEPLPEGGAVDPKRWLAMVQPPLERLGSALEAVAVDARENAQTLLEKRTAFEAARDEVRRTASMLSALFLYAGLPELAERLRPTERRTRGEETPPDVPAPPAPAPTS